MEPDPSAPEAAPDSATASPAAVAAPDDGGAKRTRARKKAVRSGSAVAPEVVAALRQQIEELERAYAEQLAQEQAETKRLRRKLKALKKVVSEMSAQLEAQQGAASAPQSTSARGVPSKEKDVELLELRAALARSEGERAALVKEKRAALAELERLRAAAVTGPALPSALETHASRVSAVGTPRRLSSASNVGLPVSKAGAGATATATDLSARAVLDWSHRKGVTTDLLAHMASAIETSAVLVSLNLSHIKLGPKGISLLTRALTNHRTLASLTLERCSLTDAGVVAVADAVRTMPSVTFLSLRGNRFASQGCKAVVAALVTLASLDVSHCSLKAEHVATLASGLTAASQLAFFALSANTVGSAAAKALGDNLSRVETLEVDSCQMDEDALALLCAGLERPNALASLNLSRNVFGCAALCRALASPTCVLEELLLVGCALDESQSASLVRAVSKSSTMRHLDLWGSRVNAKQLGSHLADAKLTHLDLRGVALGVEGLRGLCSGLIALKALESLDLSGNGLGEAGGAVVGDCAVKCGALDRLALDGNSLGNEGVRQLMERIKASHVSELSLQLNLLDDAGMSAFATWPESLASLDLSWNHIGPSGVRELLPCVMNKLDELLLQGNNVGGEGAQTLLVEENTRLAHLNLSSNNLRHEGARAVARLLAAPKSSLTQLDVAKNGFDDDAAGAIAGALRSNTSVTSLNLADNRIAERGVVPLAEMLQLCRFLTALDLSKNPLGADGEERLRDAVQRNPSVHVTL